MTAAQGDTSPSTPVARPLQQVAGDPGEDDEVWSLERGLIDEGIGLQVGEVTWTRDDLHER